MNRSVDGKFFRWTPSLLARPPVIPKMEPMLIRECYCPNGHNLIQDHGSFHGQPGISLLLKGEAAEGIVSISPIIGDKDRKCICFESNKGEIVDICCPTCTVLLPIYNLCECGASLVAMFNTMKSDFADCIGICQRNGCLNSEIIGTYDLRRLSHNGFY